MQNEAQQLTVGPSRCSQGGVVYFKEYEIGGIAIQVFGPEGPLELLDVRTRGG